MRILICSLEAPLPPLNGLRLHVSALVRELRKEHDVRVLAYLSPDQRKPDDSPWMRLIPDGREGPIFRIWGWLENPGQPPGVEGLAAGLAKPLRQELKAFGPDVVHVTSGRLARIGLQLRKARKVLVALDAWHLNVDAEAKAAKGLRRLIRRYHSRLVKMFERWEYRRFDRVIVVTEADRQALLDVNAKLPIEVIPNGVDADAFDWDGTPRDRGVILFTGVMSYAPNVMAAEFLARCVLPLVRRAVPGSRVVLVGRDPAPEVRALGALPSVEVVGEVLDMRPWLSRAGVYACPMLSGTGIKNKLLEAMANGLPCVATPLALQGISAKPEDEVLVGATEEELARRIIRLLQDSALADRVGAAGRAYARAHHAWSSTAAKYARVYREVASKRPGAGPVIR